MNGTRRAQSATTGIDLAHEADFDLGILQVSPSTRVIKSPGGSEVLEPRVMQALVCLSRAQGVVVSRDDLIQSCWSGRIVSEDAVNRCIAKLRQLAESNEPPAFTIETIPRVGYRLSPGTEALPNGSRQSVERIRISICVLPFVNMSDDPQQEYFADGITEDIITDLQKISALFVIARNSSFMFKGKNVDILQLSQQLKVSHVLEGSVRKSGSRVRITAQLIDGGTGGHLWADRYDRDLNDIFAVQDEISHSIVNALELKLLAEEKKAIGKRGTENAEAYTLYLMARQNYILGNEADDRPAEAIVRLCTRATEIDPGYAPAWALMALGQSKLQYIHHTGDGGLSAAQRALALDGKLAEAHAVLAKILFERGLHNEGAREIAVALSLDAGSYEVNRAAGLLSYRQHRLQDAVQYWQKAAAAMETDIYSSAMLISCHRALGDGDAVQRAGGMTLARSEKTLAQDQNNGAAMSYSAYALAALGQAERAKERMERALLIEPDNVNWRYNFACALTVYLNECEAALDLLGPAIAKMGRSFVNYAKTDPDIAPLRKLPRFLAMLSDAEKRLAAEDLAESKGR